MHLWRLASFAVGSACLLMVLMGIWAYNNMPLHFKSPPAEVSRQVYNQFYLVPYAGMAASLFIFSGLGLSVALRAWLSAACLGISLFGLFFIQAKSVGHDFGHVIFGGCFESQKMTVLILYCNIITVSFCGLITFYSARDFYRFRRAAVA